MSNTLHSPAAQSDDVFVLRVYEELVSRDVWPAVSEALSTRTIAAIALEGLLNGEDALTVADTLIDRACCY